MTVQEDYEALLHWRTERYIAGRDLWEPGVGGSLHLSRIIMHSGGFVEFAKPCSNVFLRWSETDAGVTRDALAFTTRKTQAMSSADYISTYGFTFIIQTEPAKSVAWGFGHGFSPAVVALQIEGPCMFEDLVYG